MGRVVSFASEAWTAGIPQRAVVVALVVGSTVNLINQGDAILGGGRVNLAKLALTYTVPFLVSIHGAISARRRMAKPG